MDNEITVRLRVFCAPEDVGALVDHLRAYTSAGWMGADVMWALNAENEMPYNAHIEASIVGEPGQAG